MDEEVRTLRERATVSRYKNTLPVLSCPWFYEREISSVTQRIMLDEGAWILLFREKFIKYHLKKILL